MRLRRGKQTWKQRCTRWLTHTFLPHKKNNHRPWLLHPHGLATVSIVVVALHVSLALVLHFPIFPNVLGEADNITSSDVLSEINKERSAQNLPPLNLSAELSAAAQEKGADMIRQGYWSHTSPTGTEPWDFIHESGYEYSVAGENLARNFHNTDMMVSAWMASQTHRANILHEQYQDTGIAVVKGVMNGRPTTVVVQLFGTPEESPVAVNLPERAYSATQMVVNNAVGSTTNVLGAQISLTPVHFYRAGILTVLAILMGVLTYDMLHAQSKKLKRNVSKNLAHIILLIATIATVLLAEGGSLL